MIFLMGYNIYLYHTSQEKGDILVHSTSSFYTSPYFQLEQVAEGVYAAIVIEGTGAWGNAGIVDLGNQTLVFDTFFTPAAATSLRQAAERVTQHPVTYVINSHRHADHVFGNQAFPNATIISTEQTRQLMQTRNPIFLEQIRTGQASAQHLTERLHQEHNPQKRKELERYLKDIQALSSNLNQLDLRLPNLTFEHHIVLHGTKRNVEVISFVEGHTPSDTILYLPEDAIAFPGDLVQVRFHPSMGDSEPETWMHILIQIEALKLNIVVPGHGQVGTSVDVVAMRHYLADMVQLVAQVTTTEQILNIAIPALYADWDGASTFTDNLLFLYKKVQDKT